MLMSISKTFVEWSDVVCHNEFLKRIVIRERNTRQ